MKIHPDLKDVVEKCDGQLDYIVKTVATKTRKQEMSERTSAIYILPLEIDMEGINDMEDVYDMVRRLKLSMHIHSTDKVNVFLGEGLDNDYIRKIFEFILLYENKHHPSHK